MNHLPFWLGLLLGVLAGTGGCSSAPPPKPPSGQGELIVVLKGFRNDRGQALVSVFRERQGFPDDVALAWRNQGVPIFERQAETRFRDLPFGAYAISVLHDEDLDNRMQTSWLGTPQEGFGLSGFPDYHWGRPDFDEVALQLEVPRRMVTIKMRYQTGRSERRRSRTD